MAKDNKYFYVDRNPGINYPEQGTQYDFLPDDKMHYQFVLPDCAYVFPDYHRLPARDEKSPEKSAEIRTDFVMQKIAHVVNTGYTTLKNKPGNLRDKNETIFQQHYSTGIRNLNPAKDFALYPLMQFSMDIDFNSGLNLRKFLSNFSVTKLQKAEKKCFSFEDINKLSKPQNFRKLTEDISRVSMMFAFEFCCNQNPLMRGALDRCKFFNPENEESDPSMANRLVYYQGFNITRKLPYYALDNDIAIFVTTNSAEDAKYGLVQDVANNGKIAFSKAAITDPLHSPYALINGLQLSAHENHFQSSLGQNDLVNKEFTAVEMRLLNTKLQHFISNYNRKHETRPLAKVVELPRAAAETELPVKTYKIS